MKISSAGNTLARLLAPFFSARAAQTGAENAVHFFEALQGIGTGAAFTRRELNAVFAQVHHAEPVVVDVGAYTGQFLQAAVKSLPSGSAFHAFEPSQASFRKLAAHFAHQPNIHLNRAALSRLTGSGVLFYPESGSQLASLTARPSFDSAKSEGVKLETLDRYCQTAGLTQIHLLKIDAEGHELEVLEGASDLLTRQAIHQILFEFGGCHIDTRTFFRDLYDLLTSHKMQIARLLPAGKFMPVEKYNERLERFRTTNYLATRP